MKVRSILSDVEYDPDANESVILDGHALFCQMDVLCHFAEGDMGWKEAARLVTSLIARPVSVNTTYDGVTEIACIDQVSRSKAYIQYQLATRLRPGSLSYIHSVPLDVVRNWSQKCP